MLSARLHGSIDEVLVSVDHLVGARVGELKQSSLSTEVRMPLVSARRLRDELTQAIREAAVRARQKGRG